MNQCLVDNWNSVVGPEDTVYVLGDFSLSARAVELITPRLLGHKKLVPGNHDHVHTYNKKARTPEKYQKQVEFYRGWGWEVLPEQVELELPGVGVVQLCHMPYSGDSTEHPADYTDKYARWRPQDTGGWLLHGHTHSPRIIQGKQYHVGVDAHGYAPVSQEQIIQDILEVENDK